MGSTNAVVALAGGKLSKVVHAMCDGLLVAADRDDFYVDMNTFGDTADFGAPNNECCYGCAATCTLMRLTGVQLTTRTITGHSNHATAVGLPVKDVVLVAPGTLPKTSSGKLQRALCKQRYLAEELQLV